MFCKLIKTQIITCTESHANCAICNDPLLYLNNGSYFHSYKNIEICSNTCIHGINTGGVVLFSLEYRHVLVSQQ